MGTISNRLDARLRQSKRSSGRLQDLAQQGFSEDDHEEESVGSLIRAGHDPLHAEYVAAQRFMSLFSEAVTSFAELEPFGRIVGPAEDEYMPSGPPWSPLTSSYFTTWALLDVRFGRTRCWKKVRRAGHGRSVGHSIRHMP